MKLFSSSLILALVLSINTLHAQGVAVNNTGATPDGSAMLDVSSTTKGFLPPRMTLAERNLISSPANGLLIYQTNEVSGLYINKGTSTAPNWLLVGPAVSAMPSFVFATDLSVPTSYFIGVGSSGPIFTRQTIVVPTACTLRTIALSIRDFKAGTFTATVYMQSVGYPSIVTNLSATIVDGAITFSAIGTGAVAVNAGDLISVYITTPLNSLSNGVAVSVGYQ